ncbi:hypothetical protein LOTGIDRAFT_172563 [Lottia gigantea]|uniref:Probable ATP-dependent RNA helicase DDX52 n=1 Tax=Lottia gigantea TaxID=225164 RepID=V4AW20_LOTGI|nr:hypothetical protein LOTGIDRAFT_172563 [Lottia gigantea]ESP01618.1 hypothetical protein LOTGIDRAFT_172563 [Lottia gigantea]
MDGYHLFKLLGTGAKFDFKRFKDDAVKLKCHYLWVLTNRIHFERSLEFTVCNLSEKPEKHTTEMKIEDNFEIFTKKFFKLHLESLQLKKYNKKSLRKLYKIHTHGTDIPQPFDDFDYLANSYKLHRLLVENIKKVGYSQPTPIQMQAIPVMLQEREIMACAPTGSGKTAAFIIPVLHHLQAPKNEGFRALVLAPTRELAKQTFREFERLSEGLGFRVHFISKVAIAAKKFGQKSKKNFDILVTTPNRLICMLQSEPPSITLNSVEWLIIDECDKLFEDGKSGFRDQLAVIYKACDNSHIKRAMFSATFSYDVEEWCKANLDNVIQVYIGDINAAAKTVKQELLFVGSENGKLLAVRNLIKKGIQPPVLIFVQSKDRAKDLFSELIYDGISVDVIHAERTQLQRDNVVSSFRAGKIWVLICTELMGRGIDFKGINLVINYDFPSSAVSYIHRIGRTGRAGRPGHAITFFTEDDATNLKSIANVIRKAGCPVPKYMLSMKKTKKEVLKKMAISEVPRQRISTVPLFKLQGKDREQ